MASYTFRFILALILAVVATIANFVWLKTQNQTTNYLYFKKDIKRGETITSSCLAEDLALPASSQNLPGIFFMQNEKELILGTQAVKNYQTGQLIERRDILESNKPARYCRLGPFRLLSISQTDITIVTKYKNYPKDASNSSVKEEFGFDLWTRRFLELANMDNALNKNSFANNFKICGIVSYDDLEANTQEINTVNQDASNNGADNSNKDNGNIAGDNNANSDNSNINNNNNKINQPDSSPKNRQQNEEEPDEEYQLLPDECRLTVSLPPGLTIPKNIQERNNPKIYFVVPEDVLPENERR